MIMAVTSKLYIFTLTINIGANSQVYRCVGENEIQRIMLKKKKFISNTAKFEMGHRLF